MNIDDYRRGMDRIAPSLELKERIMMQRTDRKRFVPVRQVARGVLAAALTVACLATVAFAASPELRTAVLSFFHMEEREQVPNSSAKPEGPDISQTEIGQLVKAQYIKMEQNTFGRGYNYFAGLFADLTWSEDQRTLLSAQFVEIQDGQLVPIEVEMNTNKIDIDYDGVHYQGELYWFVRDGELYFFKGEPYGVDTRPEDQWYVQTISGRTDAVILNLAQGRQMDYTEYPVLYHLDTGEVEDILAGTGAAELEYAYGHLWSEDMRRVLITCSDGPDGQHTWLCDLDAKTLARPEDLTGLDGEIAASFLDNDTLILTQYSKDPEGLYQDVTCYTFSPSSKRPVKPLDRAPYYRWFDESPSGAMLFGPRCVLIDQTGQLQVVDLKSGEQTAVEGFAFQKGDDFMISPSGDKLLYYHAAPEAEGLGITQLGVLDLEQNTFIAFDREGYENLHEEAIGWEDNNTVSINARTLDDETQYLLLYQF